MHNFTLWYCIKTLKQVTDNITLVIQPVNLVLSIGWWVCV